MFSRIVQNNNFCDEIGDALFPNITGNPIKNDYSLITVMRALLGTRTDDNVQLLYRTGEVDFPGFTDDFKGLVIYEINPENKEEAEEQIKSLSDDLIKLSGFSVLTTLNEFWEKKIKQPACFCINKNEKRAVVFAHSLTHHTIHLICGILPSLLPWYFEEQPIIVKGKKIIDQKAIDLVVSCSERDPEKFNKAVGALYERYNFRDAIIQSKLKGFENTFHRAELDNVKLDINRIRRQIETLNERFREEYQKLERQTTIEAGLIEKIKRGDESESEIMELFLSCKNLYLQSVEGSSMTFVVATTINNYDPEVFERTIDNEHSFWYRTEDGRKYSKDWSDEQIEKFFRAVFEDEILKIKVCAAFTLDFGRAYFRGVGGYNYGPEFSNYMPNQHIHQYSCIGGGHETQLREAMLNRNYMGAINVCIASAGNISMQEVPTGEHHMKYLLSNTPGNCIILPDGREVTPKEALAWLEEKEGADHE